MWQSDSFKHKLSLGWRDAFAGKHGSEPTVVPTDHLMYIEKCMWSQLSESFVRESGSSVITAQNRLLTDTVNSQSRTVFPEPRIFCLLTMKCFKQNFYGFGLYWETLVPMKFLFGSVASQSNLLLQDSESCRKAVTSFSKQDMVTWFGSQPQDSP